MSETPPRGGPAAPPVALRIVRPYADENALVEHDSHAFSKTGIVLLGAPSRPVGVVLRFEITLRDGTSVIRGEGRVVGHRPSTGREEAGLMLRFTRLDVKSKELVDRVNAWKEQSRVSQPPPESVRDLRLPDSLRGLLGETGPRSSSGAGLPAIEVAINSGERDDVVELSAAPIEKADLEHPVQLDVDDDVDDDVSEGPAESQVDDEPEVDEVSELDLLSADENDRTEHVPPVMYSDQAGDVAPLDPQIVADSSDLDTSDLNTSDLLPAVEPVAEAVPVVVQMAPDAIQFTPFTSGVLTDVSQSPDTKPPPGQSHPQLVAPQLIDGLAYSDEGEEFANTSPDRPISTAPMSVPVAPYQTVSPVESHELSSSRAGPSARPAETLPQLDRIATLSLSRDSTRTDALERLRLRPRTAAQR